MQRYSTILQANVVVVEYLGRNQEQQTAPKNNKLTDFDSVNLLSGNKPE